MYAYIKGRITEVYENELVVETVSGVAYSLQIGPNTLARLAKIHTDADATSLSCLINVEERFYTSFIVREDAQLLYAFISRQDKLLFELLLSIPRIGAKLAQSIVDNLSPAALMSAVLQDDIKTLISVKGLGKKVAERVLLELKGKLNKLQPLVGEDMLAEIAKHANEQAIDKDENIGDMPIDLPLAAKIKQPAQQMYEDLLSALLVLNFSLHESKQMLKLTFDANSTVEENLKRALQSR